jgi:murein DD-endopeptidase MepM/ murein hydrolase activator NlpD
MKDKKNTASFSLKDEKFDLDAFNLRYKSSLTFLSSRAFSACEIIKVDKNTITLDLSREAELFGVPLSGLPVDHFNDLINRALLDAETRFAYGRWAENRGIYANDLFNSNADTISEKRSIHLGLDVFCDDGTKIYSPLDGRIHIKTNNKKELDYGPLLILEHNDDEGGVFFTLYGHLDSKSLINIHEGDKIIAGQLIAEVGAPPENGNWPPHLHFQIILDLLGLGSDFPGVAFPSEKEKWLALSPCPSMFFLRASTRIDTSKDNNKEIVKE